MRICHVTPHLPPDQAANALLPVHIASSLARSGDCSSFVAHPSRQLPEEARGSDPSLPGPVTWVPLPPPRGPASRRFPPPRSLVSAMQMALAARPAIAEADVVHVHSNGLLPEVAAWLARRMRKPTVLTMYGTEIWHYAPRSFGPDLFTLAYRRAAHVTFYSQGLKDHAIRLGLARQGLSVVYPPVAEDFRELQAEDRAPARRMLGAESGPLVVNVKRLHPLAGQRYLIEAMPHVIRRLPGTRLVICGTGQLRAALEERVRALGLERNVSFAGLVDNRSVALHDAAADVFVLPSLLEACPTVALEALACGTPVVSTDNPGGVELQRIFGADVVIVPMEQPDPLAEAMIGVLTSGRRVARSTLDRIDSEFRAGAVAARFRAIYDSVLLG